MNVCVLVNVLNAATTKTTSTSKRQLSGNGSSGVKSLVESKPTSSSTHTLFGRSDEANASEQATDHPTHMGMRADSHDKREIQTATTTNDSDSVGSRCGDGVRVGFI